MAFVEKKLNFFHERVVGVGLIERLYVAYVETLSTSISSFILELSEFSILFLLCKHNRHALRLL